MEGPQAEQLFSDHLPRATLVADNYCRKFNALRTIKEDIRSESACGLWEACLRYNPTTNNTFWTFAYLRIRGSIVDYCRRQKIFLRDWEVKSGRKNIEIVSLSDCVVSTGHSGEVSNHEGFYYAFGQRLIIEDKKNDIEINKIEVGRMIDSGTNGMPKDKKEIMKKYFCDGMNIPDMFSAPGKPKGKRANWGSEERYAWEAIREGVEELKSSIGENR